MSKWFYTVAHTAVNILWHLWFKLELRGRENVPKSGPFVFCSNHVSGLDPTIVCLGVPTRIKLRFIGKAELFENPFLRILFEKGLGCFPIERGSADMGALDKAINIVKDGGALAIFPEGTRSKDGYLLRFKSGMSLIVQQTKADVLPCNITYLDGKKFRGRVVVNYGPVIPYETLGFSDSQSPRELKSATRLIHAEVEKLSLLPPKPAESEE